MKFASNRNTSKLIAILIAAAAAACSGNAGPALEGSDELPEGTGRVELKLQSVPENVRCVVIQTSDWRTPYAQVDVNPGTPTTIRLSPISPGYVSLSGQAYDVACSDIYGKPSYDGGPYDAGVAQPTWEAQSTYAYVQSGSTASAFLTFRRPGSLDVIIGFDEPCASADAGPDSGGCGTVVENWPTYDAGSFADAGAATPAPQP